MGMMINRRRVCGGKKLPYDAEIEYLCSTGTQYIDTEYVPNDNTELEICYTVTKLPSALYNGIIPYGCRVGFGNKQYNIFSPVNNSTECYICYGNSNRPFDYEVLNNKIIVHANANTITFVTHTETFSLGNMPNLNIYIFGLNQNGSLFTANRFELNVEYFKVKENNNYILNMIPVRVGQVGYMYDKVSGNLFGNSGTGSLILGPDKAS